MSQPVLTTRRLRLRPFRTGDIDGFHAILSDPRIMRYWGDLHVDRAATEGFVKGTIAAPADITCDFAIERDGVLIGKAGMWRKPEIGFFIHADHQRQGYAREALDVILPHLFSTYDIDPLTADVDPRNTASLTLLKILGFVETHRATGTMTMNGELCDSVYLALRRSI